MRSSGCLWGLALVLAMSAASADDGGECDALLGFATDVTNSSGALVVGAVEHPGQYVEAGGAPIWQVLEMAGGMQPSAYPLGVKVFRRGVTNRVGPEGSEALLSASPSNIALDAMQIFMGLAGRCTRHIAGHIVDDSHWQRIAIEINPAAGHRNRTAATRLIDGDVLIVPQRPSGVMVAGYVLHPGMVAFRSTADARDYIDDAGGLASGARLGNAFVYLPHGVRRPLSASVWNYQRQNVPPGSVIIVPGITDTSSRLWRQLTRYLD